MRVYVRVFKRLSLLIIATALLSSAAYCTEFISNGSLARALPGGNRCETAANAFYCWTLTPENGGGTNYSADEFWSDTRLCGCNGVPCQIYPEISQSFGISNGGAYTLTWEQRNDQEACSTRATMWANMTSIGTVYYFRDAALTQPCGLAFEDTGNVTSPSKGVWAPILLSGTDHAPLNGTAPADCRYIKVVIKGFSKANTCSETGGVVRAWTEIRNVSFTSNAFTKTSGAEPIISQQPVGKTVSVGDQVTLTVAVSGPGTLSYQWQKKPSGGSFADISGATSALYTTPVLSAGDDSAQFRCRVSGACASIYSDAATVTVLNPVVVSTIAEVKGYSDGTLVKLLSKTVSARTSSDYWIQDIDPLCGIRVESAAFPAAGTKVTVTGTLTTTDGERRITPSLESWGTVGETIKPVFMTTRAVGGAELNDNTPGVTDAYGPNNIGLLVKVYGTVTGVGGSYYYLDDGAALSNSSDTDSIEYTGLRIIGPSGGLEINDSISVTGVVSTFRNGSETQRAITLPGCTMPDDGLPVGAVSSVLCEGQSTSITVGPTEVGVSYLLRNGSVNLGSLVAGNGGVISLPTGPLPATTVFNVLAIRDVGDCSVQLAQTRTVTVDPLPNAGLAVSAEQCQINVGQSANVTVAGSQVGVNYQLRKSSDNSNVDSPVAGTGGTINLPTGALTTGGNITFNVLATNASSGCGIQLTQTVTIAVGATGALTGKVRNAMMQPIAGATVTTVPVTSTATTTADGSYTINGVPPGTYNINFARTGYQTGTWYYESVTANTTTTVPDKLLPRGWSKIGAHVVMGTRTGWGTFLQQTKLCGKPCQMVKMVDDFGAASDAKTYSPNETLTVGRINDTPSYDLQGFDQYADPASPNYTPPAQFAQIIFNELHNTTGKYWAANEGKVDVWEVCNEWSWWWAYQADFYIALMDIAEANGHRIAIYGCSGGNPPEAYWPDIARACARAKAHGGHMLSLHEYAWSGTLQDEYNQHPGDVVLRYRKLYNYLRQHDADCPMILTEVGENGGGGFIGDIPFVTDFGWYDDQCRQDDYVFGIAAWTLGNWGGANWYTALPELGDYICSH